MHGTRWLAFSVACLCTVGACTGSGKTSTSMAAAGPKVEAGKAFPAGRCAANKAAGPITYISGYDFAASASIIDVLLAEQRGYFDALCLDVRVRAGIASANYTAVNSNTAQFSSGGSFSELTAAALAGSTDLVALAVEGKAANDALILKPGTVGTLADLRHTTIGVKNTLPPSVAAMLAKVGLVEGADYSTRALEDFDPIEHMAVPDIVGFTGFTSNEPGELERAGVAYMSFEPANAGIPGSFGVLYTNRTFAAAHPTAATDFMRAAMQGLSDAVADPGSASMVAIDFIDNHGNPNHLSVEGEAYRWQTESKTVVDSTPKDEPLGLPDVALLQDELDAYAAIGVFGSSAPKVGTLADPSVLRSVYDTTGTIIWPAR